jgi:hypothetical protein
VRTLKFKFLRWVGGVALLCTVLAACSEEQVDQKGGSMFGLFNGKKSVKSQTTVATEVGAVLQSHTAVPAQLPPPVAPAYPACKLAHLRGLPPEGNGCRSAGRNPSSLHHTCDRRPTPAGVD